MRYNYFKSLVLIFLAGSLVACGGGYNPDADAAAGSSFDHSIGGYGILTVGDPSGLTLNPDNTIEGEGSFRFADTLDGIETNNNYILNFELAADGQLVFIANSRQDLTRGIEMTFKRVGATSDLQVTIETSGNVIDISDFFVGIKADQSISLMFDVHNNHGASAHIIAWDHLVDSDNAILDGTLGGRGFGKDWGIRVSDSKLLSVSKGPPKDDH